jgi:hypothetical protein
MTSGDPAMSTHTLPNSVVGTSYMLMLGVGGGWTFNDEPIGAVNGHPGFPDMDAVSRSRDSSAVAETCCIWIGIQPPDAGQGGRSQGRYVRTDRACSKDAEEREGTMAEEQRCLVSRT